MFWQALAEEGVNCLAMLPSGAKFNAPSKNQTLSFRPRMRPVSGKQVFRSLWREESFFFLSDV